MANSHPFDIALDNYLLSDARWKIVVQGDLGRVQSIKDIGIYDFETNLEQNNLITKGEVGQIISKDGEVIMSIQIGDSKSYRIVYLKHEGDQVHLVHHRACIPLRCLKIQIGKWKLAIQIKI